ncbi:MAG: protein kinase, partial [Planctomycetaceae bacterium]|nr:protein kinase [Planctomycetaceae bacterium]
MKFTFPPETRVLDGYTIKRAIYRGGFGEVYYALSDGGREVALKLLQNNTEIELRGVQQCLNLSHPNLVTIFDVREDADGDHWIIMEYIGGETLDAAIRRHPQGMPMEVVRRWLPG